MTSSPLPSTSNIEKFRSQSFNLNLYTEWDNFSEILSNLKHEGAVFMGAMIHDKDVHDDGTPKKEHCHVVIKFKSQVWSSALCKRTGVPHRYKIIEPTHDFRKSVRYLIHFDNPEKYQYDYDDIWASDAQILKAQFTDVPDDSQVEREIFDAMMVALMNEDFSSEMEFISWCYSMGYSKVANKWKYTIHNSFSLYQGCKR